ncbi:MAG: tryptophan 2,3-dioxygenase family protein [Chitinophagales bacterium]
MDKPVEYTEYLQLDKILRAQELESDKRNAHAHDEMLFIIIHQAYELWFKQIHFEVDSALDLMRSEKINDNSPALQTIVHRMGRVVTILQVLVHQIDILETMTPMDFHTFRDMLRPASGFQSWQFKMLEAKLGLKFDQRHGKEYYTSMLKDQYVDLVKKVEQQSTLLENIDAWLSRMPFFDDAELWRDYSSHTSNGKYHAFWNDYLEAYTASLVEGEKQNRAIFEDIFLGDGKSEYTTISRAAMRNALFISMYRGYPILHLPFELMQALIDIDEQMATWRFRHINMVHRMIGSRVDAGGSSGKDYLQGALNKHYIFRDFAMLSSFMIQSEQAPVLPKNVQQRLGFY